MPVITLEGRQIDAVVAGCLGDSARRSEQVAGPRPHGPVELTEARSQASPFLRASSARTTPWSVSQRTSVALK